MSTPSTTAALPIAEGLLKLLIPLNWLFGGAVLALLVVLPHESWILRSFHLEPSQDASHLVLGLRLVALIGLMAIPVNHAVLSRLLAIVGTVRGGDPFVAANAVRLRAIAWALLILQLLSLFVGAVEKAISSPEHPVHFSAGFSINGWLAVLLTFVLAAVFNRGAAMREDLDGVV